MNNNNRYKKIFLALITVTLLLASFRSFVADQIRLKGDGYMGYNMVEDAIRQYRKAAILDPANSQIRTRLGYAYKRASDRESAIKAYEKAVELDPQNIVAYHNLGIIHAFSKDIKRAKECFLRASSITYNDKKITKDDYGFYHYASLDMLALYQERLGDIEGAIETCEEILRTSSDANDPLTKRVEDRLERLKEISEP